MTDGEPGDTASDMATTCVVCGKYTTNKCGGCKLKLYCGKVCQTKNWPTHKVSCLDIKLERELRRVATIVHEAFLCFRENTWDGIIIKKVEEKDGALVIHDGNLMAAKGWFREFPHKFVSSNPRDKMAVLTAWCCDEPYGFLHELIAKLLEGLKVDMAEIGVKLANLPRKTMTVFYDGRLLDSSECTQHATLVLRSRHSGKRWLFDIAGGQYGITEPLHVWTEYEAAFVQSVAGIYSFGSSSKDFDELAHIQGYPALTYGVVGEAAKVLHKAADTWAGQHTALRKLRLVNSAEFPKQKTSLLAALNESVRTFMSTNDFADEIRIVRDIEHRDPSVAQQKVNAFATEKARLGRQRLCQKPGSLSTVMLV